MSVMVRFLAGGSLLALLAASLAAAAALPPGEPSPGGWSRDRDGDRLDDALASTLAHGADWLEPHGQAYALSFVDGAPRFGVFVDFGREATARDLAALRAAGARHVETFGLIDSVYVPDADAATVQRIAALDIDHVEWDLVYRPKLSVSVAALKARASEAYPRAVWEDFNVTGSGVAVAILDTGVDDEHDMLAGKYRAGFDATHASPLYSISAFYPLLFEVNPDSDDVPDYHGTHVAAIALGGAASAELAGVAPGASLVDVKVLSATGASLSSMTVRALDWLVQYNAGQTGYGVPTEKVRIASLSLGGYPITTSGYQAPQGDDEASNAVNAAVAEGIVVVAAAGNCGPDPALDCPAEGDNTVATPGAAEHAITVAAVTDHSSVQRDDDELADYSSRGPNGGEPKPNVAAPGTAISSAEGSALPGQAGGETKSLSGTSMATPHVAGLAALMLEANPGLTPPELKDLLLLAAEDRGEPGWDPGYGQGEADAYAAVVQALRLADDPRADRAEGVPELPGGGAPVGGGPVSIGGNDVPRPKFIFRPASPVAGREVRFEDQSVDPDGEIVRRVWTFGDGSTSGEREPGHVYAREGSYLVTLTVTDDRGATRAAQATLDVGPAPRAESPGLPGFELAGLLAAAVLLLALRRRR